MNPLPDASADGSASPAPALLFDAVLSPAEIDGLPQRDLSQTICVVFDVLRATSSMLTALAHGTEEIRPVTSIEAALEARQTWPDATLGGERFGDRIEGFDLGNSPLEYAVGDASEASVIGQPGSARQPRRIITTTTNGTVALQACAAAREVWVGALLNMRALADRLGMRLGELSQPESATGETQNLTEKLAQNAAKEVVENNVEKTKETAAEKPPLHVLLVCAGTFRELALEDVLAAGMLAAQFPAAALSDAAQVALALYRQHEGDLHSALRQSKNGQALRRARRDADVAWCAQVSRYPLVGVMRSGVVRNGA